MKKPLKEMLEKIGGKHLLNEVSTEKVEFKTITDNDGYTWKVDAKTGKWLERI